MYPSRYRWHPRIRQTFFLQRKTFEKRKEEEELFFWQVRLRYKHKKNLYSGPPATLSLPTGCTCMKFWFVLIVYATNENKSCCITNEDGISYCKFGNKKKLTTQFSFLRTDHWGKKRYICIIDTVGIQKVCYCDLDARRNCLTSCSRLSTISDHRARSSVCTHRIRFLNSCSCSCSSSSCRAIE